MTPHLSLNPPGPSMQGQNQLFNIPPNTQDSSTSSLSCRTSFNKLDRRQTLEVGELRVKDQQQDDKHVLHDGSSPSNNSQVCNSSSFNYISPQPVMEEPISRSCDHNLPSYKVWDQEGSKDNGHGSAKWMPSKMRLMKKMMMRPGSSAANNEDKSLINTTPSPRFQNQGHSQRSPRINNSNSTSRVCSDCNTSTTPLWRSGPNGPKSLCNACGIRQRKARRALMAEAANHGLANPMDNATSSTKTRVHNKEKKSRTNHFTHFKNKCKSTTTTTIASSSSHHQGEKKKLEYNFKNNFAISLRNNNNSANFQQVFPRDEVAEAALLLMDLSCGFVHF